MSRQDLETKNDSDGEDQQHFNRPTDRLNKWYFSFQEILMCYSVASLPWTDTSSSYKSLWNVSTSLCYELRITVKCDTAFHLRHFLVAYVGPKYGEIKARGGLYESAWQRVIRQASILRNGRWKRKVFLLVRLGSIQIQPRLVTWLDNTWIHLQFYSWSANLAPLCCPAQSTLQQAANQ